MSDEPGRCAYCDEITERKPDSGGRQFCSDEHETEYWIMLEDSTMADLWQEDSDD